MAGPAWKEIVCHYASCNDCCIVHSNGVCADPELVGDDCGWSCRLLLHPALNCADVGPNFAPCTLTFGRNTPLVHIVVSPTATCAGGTF